MSLHLPGSWQSTRNSSLTVSWRSFWTGRRSLSSREATSRIGAPGVDPLSGDGPKLQEPVQVKLSVAGVGSSPDHLLVLVHGLVGTVRDWNYIRDQFSARLGRHFFVYASSCNESAKTFQGVDRAGERLADEVRTLVSEKPSLKHITILGHSLGGLIARYAIALLYGSPDSEPHNASSGHSGCTAEETRSSMSQNRGKIAGLDAACFITLATPHLGVRGKGQLPFLLGVDLLERIAVPMAPLVVGRTGKQLFLADGKPSAGNMPLLLRMTSQSRSPDEPPFLAALGAFHTRVVYANAGFDHMVGWQTSSIRRASELPQIPRHPISPVYKHVMLVQNCPAVPFRDDQGQVLQSVAGISSDCDQREAEDSVKARTVDLNSIQEEMICGLQTLAWRKVDVSFRNGFFPFFAHNNIHVKMHWLHFDGAGVVRHLLDTMQELESLYLQSRL